MLSKALFLVVAITGIAFAAMPEAQKKVTQVAYIDVGIYDEFIGRIVIGLFGDDAPKTVANFVGLCKGDHTNKDGKKLTYVGTPFHRII